MKQKGLTVEEITVTKPCTENQLLKKEKKLGVNIPISFRNTLKNNYSSFHWSCYIDEMVLGEENIIPHFPDIRFFGVDWNINDLEIPTCFIPDVSEEFSAEDRKQFEHFYNYLAFCRTCGGNLYAFDLSHPSDDKPVFYIDYEIDRIIYLADNSISFLNKNTELFNPSDDLDYCITFIDESGINLGLPTSVFWKKISSDFFDK